MQKILVIGAGPYQVPLIRRIIELGYEAYCVDRNPEAEGFQYATGYRVINVLDQVSCLAYANELKISAILTYGATLTLPTVAYIGKKLGLPAIPIETAELSRNKYKIKERLAQAGCNVKGKTFLLDGTDKDKQECIYPCVIKPCDGSGSKGVSIVEGPESFEQARAYAFASARYGEVYSEGYIQGDEYSVEAFVNHKKIYIYGIVKTTFERLGNDNESLEYGHRIPAGIPLQAELEIQNEITKAICALGINLYSVNFDVIYSHDDQKAYIIDCGIRIGQNLISSHLVPLSRGVRVIDQTIMLSLGHVIDPEPRYTKYIASRLLIYNPGRIEEIRDVSELIGIDGIADIVFRKKVGDLQRIYTDKSDTCGWVICQGVSPEDAEQKAVKARHEIKKYITIV